MERRRPTSAGGHGSLSALRPLHLSPMMDRSLAPRLLGPVGEGHSVKLIKNGKDRKSGVEP